MTTLGLLLTRGHDIKPEWLGAYSAALPPLYRKFGGRYLAIGGPGRGATALGASPEASGMVAVFEGIQAVRDFWWSEAYRQVVPLRAGAGQFDVFGLETVVTTPPTAGSDIYVAYAAQPETLVLDALRAAGAMLVADTKSFDRLEGAPPWQRIAVLAAPADAHRAVDAAAATATTEWTHIYRIDSPVDRRPTS
ncbi:MAG: DUF1330 domain-containing protein [Steroidobacteraceae bacterium]